MRLACIRGWSAGGAASRATSRSTYSIGAESNKGIRPSPVGRSLQSVDASECGRDAEVPSRTPLSAREVFHGDLLASGWRYCGADVSYIAPRAVALGGPAMFATVAAASASARRRARRAAGFAAAPQWRPLGELRIRLTEDRLLVWHNGEWASVWYHTIRELRPDPAVNRLDIYFENDSPYCLVGPDVLHLTAVLNELLAPAPVSG